MSNPPFILARYIYLTGMKSFFLLLMLFAITIFKTNKVLCQNLVDTNNMVRIEKSTFLMGLDSIHLQKDMVRFNEPASFFYEEYPAFRVTVPTFYLDKYEVSNAKYQKFVKANPKWSKTNIPDSLHDGNYLKDWNGDIYPKGKAKYPVVYINYYAANAYAKWMGKRLPGEAEMESAAKGRDKTAEFTWGNENVDSKRANYEVSHVGSAQKVGSYKHNNLGLYDMAGNVFELCADIWRPNAYQHLPINKQKVTIATGNYRVVVRGGGWNSPDVMLRTTYRQSQLMKACFADVGFRCALSIPTKP